MNKNTLIGLLLIGVILFGYSWYSRTQQEEKQAQYALEVRKQQQQDSITLANAPKADSTHQAIEPQQLANDSIAKAAQVAALGKLVEAREGTEEFKTLENDLFKLTFSNKGGRIAAVELKDYKTYGGTPLMLFHEQTSNFGISLYVPDLINTSDYYFEATNISSDRITYRLKADSLNYVDFNYSIKPDDHMMDMSIDLSHFKGRLAANQPDVELQWHIVSPQQEKGFQNENNYSTVVYRFPGEDSVEDLGMSDKEKKDEISTKVEWVAFKQQFFSSIIISKDNFVTSKIGYNTFAKDDKKIKDFNAILTLPYTPETQKYDFNLYFGPNKYAALKAYDGMSMQRLVPLGWGIFGWVNRLLVIPVFDFFGSYIASFGIVIMLLTIFVKLLILPLTYKSYLSTAKMRLLKPEIDKISEKFPKKEEAMKKQQATMALYKSAGVSPMGGCLPMLIQMPILFAMIRFFPSAIELRQKSFLWADDLSSFDTIWTFPGGFSIPFYGDHISLFTLLMAVTMFISTKLNADQQMSSNQMPGMKFMMLYLMPVMMLFFFNNYAAGLTWYFCVSSVFGIGQTYMFRYAVSDSKLHAQMKENAKKPVKKSKFAARLEDMQKQAAAQQRGQQPQQKPQNKKKK